MAKINEIIDGIKRKAALLIIEKGAGYSEGELRLLLISVRKAEKNYHGYLKGKRQRRLKCQKMNTQKTGQRNRQKHQQQPK